MRFIPSEPARRPRWPDHLAALTAGFPLLSWTGHDPCHPGIWYTAPIVLVRISMSASVPTGGATQAPSAAPAGARRSARLRATVYWLIRRWQFWAVIAVLGLAAVGLKWASPNLRFWYHLRAGRSELDRYHNPQAIR